MTTRPGRRRVTVATLLVLVGAALGTGLPTTSTAVAADAAAPAYTATKTLTRELAAPDGTISTIDSRAVTVSVDVTTNLLARQVIDVRWTGAHPSGARSADPRGEKGLAQEYPVVVLQCRGRDDTSLPADQQLSPETCWTTFFKQRSDAVGTAVSVWRHDLYATPAERAEQSTSPDWPTVCPGANPFQDQYQVPFRGVDGTVYEVCNAETQAPEMGFDGALPAQDVAAFTGTDGTGRTDFEIRTSDENETLGCSATTPCSLVVIPIMGLSCADANAECRRTGKAEPGSSYNVSIGSDPVTGPAYWWSASNWRNRFVVPLTIAPAPAPCDALDSRAPVDFFGSELLSQASLQWAPAYCLADDRFKYRHNRMSEPVAFTTMLGGHGAAALVSREQDDPDDAPVAYAPVAVTGFAIAFVLDQPDNKGPVTRLRLTPRLLAKLLTQSYLGSSLGASHEGITGNPRSLNEDPEFLELNPDVNTITTESMATVLSLSIQSDVVEALTAYVAADPEASAFVSGTADPWGMVVNPSYRGETLPTSEWSLKDSFIPAYSQECQTVNYATTPYFSQIAAPVTSLTTIAEDVLDAHPNVQTRCEKGTSSEPWKVGRITAQDFGTRMMLGVVSLGDAVRYGLRTAELRTSGTGAGATFVAPDDATMAAAAATATQAGPGAPFVIDATTLRSASDAYPGTMIVHAVTTLTGLDPALATDVARFITIATTEGQVRGSGTGELPEGYLPISATGPTAPLLASARLVATAIEAQSGSMAVVDTPTPESTEPVPAATEPDLSAPDTSAVAPATTTVPQTTTGLPADATPTPTVVTQRGVTQAQSTGGPLGRSLPAAMSLGALALIGVPLLRQLSVARQTRALRVSSAARRLTAGPRS